MANNIIDLDSPHSPAILAGILGINVSSVFQGRQTNIFPPSERATYRQCIQHYANHWKGKSAKKASGATEAAQLQRVKLDIARTEREWLAVKKEKQELIEVNELAELFEPAFLHIKTQLLSISRKHPETIAEIDRCLEELFHLGERTLKDGQAELDEFVQAKMEEEVELEAKDEMEELDSPLSSFDDYVEPGVPRELL